MIEPSDNSGGASLRAIRSDDLPALLALNNDHAVELSLLAPEALAHLVEQAFLGVRTEAAAAFLLAFDQDADYASPNFLWMRRRFDRFVYVDRVVVAPQARGQGLARQLYAALFAEAGRAGHRRVVCEVNSEPPNPASDAFHRALGFAEIGHATWPDGTKSVRYMERQVAGADAG